MRRNSVPIESMTFWLNAFIPGEMLMQRSFRYVSSLLLIICLVVTSSACELPKCPRKYLIPKGYVGWVRVFFNVKGAPALPKEDGISVVKFQPAEVLRLNTSSPEFTDCNSFIMNFFYYDEKGEVHSIPLEYDVGMVGGVIMIQNLSAGRYKREMDREDQQFEEFFVGTIEQFEKRDRSRDSHGQYRDN